MAAATTDKFKKVGTSTVTTLQAPGKALAATTITVGSTTNYPTDTGIVVAIRVVDSNGELVNGTYTEWNATVTSSTTLAIDAVPVYGSDQVYSAGSTTQVFIPTSSYAQNALVDGILVSHAQDGTIKRAALTLVSPSGALMMFGGSSAPTGWLFCDGSAVSRTTYSDLFTAIGTAFGAGNGTTTFNIPDLRDTFPIGKSGTKALASTGGSATHTHTGPSHTHNFATVAGGNAGDITSSNGVQFSAGFSSNVGAGGTSIHTTVGGAAGQTLTTAAGGTGNTGATSTLPTYVALNYIIKT